jgi:hypothetical protein
VARGELSTDKGGDRIRGVDGAIEARGMEEAASIEGAYVECTGDDGMLLCRYAVGIYATPPGLMVFSVIK